MDEKRGLFISRFFFPVDALILDMLKDQIENVIGKISIVSIRKTLKDCLYAIINLEGYHGEHASLIVQNIFLYYSYLIPLRNP